jgi:hypothetical protein
MCLYIIDLVLQDGHDPELEQPSGPVPSWPEHHVASADPVVRQQVRVFAVYHARVAWEALTHEGVRVQTCSWETYTVPTPATNLPIANAAVATFNGRVHGRAYV